MIKRGQYAVVDGVEYAARVRGGGKVFLFIPQTAPRPDGWDVGAADTWYREVDASEVTDAFEILTRAALDGVRVYVDSVNATDRTAIVRALESTSRGDNGAVPPHPLLEPADDSPYSIDWVAKVPWESLTDVYEACGRVDPATGRDLPDETGDLDRER